MRESGTVVVRYDQRGVGRLALGLETSGAADGWRGVVVVDGSLVRVPKRYAISMLR